MNKRWVENDTKQASYYLALILVALLMGLSLQGCHSSSSKDNVEVTENLNQDGTPSLREKGKMLSDEEVAAERKAMDFEDHYRKWISDEGYMREWLNSGQQHDEWVMAMDEFIEEIQNYSIADAPEDSRLLYDQLLARIMDLRDAGVS